MTKSIGTMLGMLSTALTIVKSVFMADCKVMKGSSS